MAALGFLAAVFIQASAWNWLGYTAHYALVQIFDSTLAFGLTGMGVAKILKTA